MEENKGIEPSPLPRWHGFQGHLPASGCCSPEHTDGFEPSQRGFAVLCLDRSAMCAKWWGRKDSNLLSIKATGLQPVPTRPRRRVPVGGRSRDRTSACLWHGQRLATAHISALSIFQCGRWGSNRNCALSIINRVLCHLSYPPMVPLKGFEPLRPDGPKILSLLCLPFHHRGMVLPAGIEPATVGLEVPRSIHLSYGRRRARDTTAPL